MRASQRQVAVHTAARFGPANLLQVLYSQHEAYGVEDVGLAGAVQACDGVELAVEWADDDPLCVRFESIDGDLLDKHGCARLCQRAAVQAI
jgi:hypothetical protein